MYFFFCFYPDTGPLPVLLQVEQAPVPTTHHSLTPASVAEAWVYCNPIFKPG